MARKQKRREYDKKDAQVWQQRHTTATSEQTKLFEKFKDYFDILYAVKSYKNMAPWRSKIYIPILAGKAWDFISRLADVEPRFVADIRDEYEIGQDGKPFFPEEVNARAEKISKKLDFDYKNPMQKQSPRDRVFSTLVDTVVTGTGIAKISRLVEEKKYRAHEASDNNGNVNMDEELVEKITEGSNTFEPVSIFNVKFAPATDDLQSAPWIIIDGFSTLDELYQAGIYDTAKLDTIDPESRTDSDPMSQYSYHRNQLVQSQDRVSADTSVKLLKTHECYSRDEDGDVVICMYVEAGGATSQDNDSWIKIYELKDPYWHNKYPLQTFYIRRKPYSIWGESLFENNESLQYASNDVFNHYMDNVNISIDGMMMMDENAFVEDFVIAPGELLLYKNEMPKQFKFNEPNPGTISIVMNTLDKAVEDATISSYATGTPSSSADKTQGTAGGIRDIMGAAEEKMGFMRSNFKNSMESVGQMWLINDQQFMDRSQTVPMQTPDGKVPMVITPLDLQGLITITIDDDSMTPVSKSQQREQKRNYIAELINLAKNSAEQAQLLGKPEDQLRLDYRNLSRDLSEAFGQTSYSQYILPAPTPEEIKAKQDEAAAVAESQKPVPAPPKQISESIKIALSELSDAERAQVLQMGGIQPDPTAPVAQPTLDDIKAIQDMKQSNENHILDTVMKEKNIDTPAVKQSPKKGE